MESCSWLSLILAATVCFQQPPPPPPHYSNLAIILYHDFISTLGSHWPVGPLKAGTPSSLLSALSALYCHIADAQWHLCTFCLPATPPKCSEGAHNPSLLATQVQSLEPRISVRPPLLGQSSKGGSMHGLRRQIGLTSRGCYVLVLWLWIGCPASKGAWKAHRGMKCGNPSHTAWHGGTLKNDRPRTGTTVHSGRAGLV